MLVDVRTFEEFNFVGLPDSNAFEKRMILLPWQIFPAMEENPEFSSGLEETLNEILMEDDKEALLHWLRHQALAIYQEDVLMVHAGVLPQWSLEEALSLAHELQEILRGPDVNDFLMQMYGNEPSLWLPNLTGIARWRCALNAFTRIRFCTPAGQMEFETKEGKAKAPPVSLK